MTMHLYGMDTSANCMAFQEEMLLVNDLLHLECGGSGKVNVITTQIALLLLLGSPGAVNSRSTSKGVISPWGRSTSGVRYWSSEWLEFAKMYYY